MPHQQETIQELRKFRNSEELKTVDSCIVVFMSHGRDDTSFYTSDNQYLTVHTIVEDFNNRHCPALQGKPKIFIFQFCRCVWLIVCMRVCVYLVLMCKWEIYFQFKTVHRFNYLCIETITSVNDFILEAVFFVTFASWFLQFLFMSLILPVS